MAKISSYNLDTTVSKNDKVIGTDSGGSTTKNFKLEDIAGFLNTSSLININGQVVYKLVSSNNLQNGEFNKTGSSNNFSSVTSFNFAHANSNDQDIETYINYFQGLRVMLTQTDNQNNFGLYNVDTITSSGEGATFSTLAVTFIEGNGAMISDKHYAMAYSPKGQTDKNFVSNNISFTANSAETITHNLNKFPSVTTVDSAGSHVVGDIQHINTNSFTITFTASFTGKVYVN